jgi:hypothetical protein
VEGDATVDFGQSQPVPEVQGEVQAVDEVLLPRWWRRRRKKSMPVFLSPSS